MKKLILLFVVVVMNVTVVSAKEVNPVDDYPQAVKSITKLLGSLTITEEFEKSEIVRFTAMINNDNELIVLQVGTKNEMFKKYLIEKLNYQKVEKGIMNPGKLYSFVVKFKPE